MYEGSLFSASSPALVLLLIIAILTLCGFDCRALMISDVKLFSWPSVCPLQRNVCSSPLPFFFIRLLFPLSFLHNSFLYKRIPCFQAQLNFISFGAVFPAHVRRLTPFPLNSCCPSSSQLHQSLLTLREPNTLQTIQIICSMGKRTPH